MRCILASNGLDQGDVVALEQDLAWKKRMD
jgi:hypothetical protein